MLVGSVLSILIVFYVVFFVFFFSFFHVLVLNVVCVSGLSNLDFPFVFLLTFILQ